MQPLHIARSFSWEQFFQQYRQTIKYGLFVLCIIGTLLGVRVYINYTYIISATAQEKQATKDMLAYNAYLNYYWKQYITSPYAIYFQNHENNRIQPGEVVVVVTNKKVAQQTATPSNSSVQSTPSFLAPQSPPQQWQQLFATKFAKITE